MKIYNYSPETSEYISETDAKESPLEPGVYLVPGFATDKKPTAAGANKVNVFEGGKWVKKDDYRGTDVDVNGETITIKTIGETPQDVIDANPPKTQAEIDAERVKEIKLELQSLDIRRIRPMAENDTAFLSNLNDQVLALRAELQSLES